MARRLRGRRGPARAAAVRRADARLPAQPGVPDRHRARAAGRRRCRRAAGGRAALRPLGPAPRAVARAAQGNAALIGVLARRVIADLRAGRDRRARRRRWRRPRRPSGRRLRCAPLRGAGRGGGAGPRRRGQAATLAGEGARAARGAGWLARDDGAGAACRARPTARRRWRPRPRRCGRGGDPRAAALPADDPRRADALAAAGRPDDAAALLCALARAAGAPGRAAGLLARAAALAPEQLTVRRLAVARQRASPSWAGTMPPRARSPRRRRWRKTPGHGRAAASARGGCEPGVAISRARARRWRGGSPKGATRRRCGRGWGACW